MDSDSVARHETRHRIRARRVGSVRRQYPARRAPGGRRASAHSPDCCIWLGLSVWYWPCASFPPAHHSTLHGGTGGLGAGAGAIVFSSIFAPVLMYGLDEQRSSASLLLNLEACLLRDSPGSYFGRTSAAASPSAWPARCGRHRLSWAPDAGRSVRFAARCHRLHSDNNLTRKVLRAMRSVAGLKDWSWQRCFGARDGIRSIVAVRRRHDRRRRSQFLSYGVSLVLFVIALRRRNRAYRRVLLGGASQIGAALAMQHDR